MMTPAGWEQLMSYSQRRLWSEAAPGEGTLVREARNYYSFFLISSSDWLVVTIRLVEVPEGGRRKKTGPKDIF